MTMADLKSQLIAWQEERQRYPGWLVPPSTNRERLTREIETSLHPDGLAFALIQEKLACWLPESRLVAWAELNWRMERALLPLPTEWTQGVEATLAKAPPFNASTADPTNFFDPEGVVFQDRLDLRWAWITLAIAVLRHHREFRRAAEFRLWQERLAPFDADWEIVHHQRAYQDALWHLTFLADDKAISVIENWAADRGNDPYWLARKAGLLAELGKPDEAKPLWDECLRRLQGFSSDASPFFATSRESAVLNAAYLTWEHRSSIKHNKYDRLKITSVLDGWEYWTELASLSQADTDYRERIERSRADSNSTYYSFKPLWKPKGAVQCFRLAEELGIPLTISEHRGGIVISGSAKALVDCFPDLALASEELAGTLLMRMRHTDFWKKQLTPAHVACIPDTLLADMLSACEEAWRQTDANQAVNEIYLVASLVSSLVNGLRWRLSPDQRKTYFKKFLGLGSRTAVRTDIFLARSIKEVIEAMSGDFSSMEVLGIIHDALTFPLPGEVDIESVFWPEPMQLRIAETRGGSLPDDAIKRINQLIDRAPSDRDALFRLFYVFKAGMLPDEASHKLADKLWLTDDGLPDVRPLQLPVILHLPTKTPGQAERALANHFTKSPPPNLRSPDKSITHSRTEWFHDLYEASKPYRNPNAPFMHWTNAQAEILLDHAETWWRQEGKDLLSTLPSQVLGFGPRQRFYWLRFSLARAIAPNLLPSSESGKIKLPKLLKEIEEGGFSMRSLYPLLLRFKVGNADDTASALIDGLRSTDTDTVVDALWGVIHWCEFKKEAKLPAVPHRLIEQLLIYLATRADGKNAAEAVGTLEAILEHDPDILSTRAKELMELALDSLQVRAAYPETWHQRDGLRYADTVKLRQNAVLLASAVQRAKISDHEAIRFWLEVGQTDPLYIVRQAIKP